MVTIDLSNRTALVTGGAGELGRAMCRTLAACGARVAVHYNSSANQAEALVKEITSAGGNAAAFQADVTNSAEVDRMRDEIKRSFGSPTIVVANAVIQYDWTSILEQSLEDYESQFRSCVMQSVHLAKAFVPDIIAQGTGGRFIAVNTECAMQCFAGQSAYAAGKRGLDGLIRVLARELGPHQITVNEIAPGWIRSDKILANEDDVQAEYIKNVPLQRAGTDQEVANVVAFIASDLSSFITGAYIPVCGGNVMPTI